MLSASAPSPIIIPIRKARSKHLIAEARRDALTLVTTEKDLARLRHGGSLPDWAQQIVPFAVTLEFDDAAWLRTIRTARLFKARDRFGNLGGQDDCRRSDAHRLVGA